MRNENLNNIPNKEDEILDISLRPKGFDEFIGQQKIVDNFKVFIGADRKSTRLNSSHEVPSRMPSSA